LAETTRLSEDVGKPQGGVLNIQVLVRGVAVAGDQERFALANPVNPGKLPGDLAEQAWCTALGRGRFDNGDREALVVVGLQEDRIGLGFVPSVGRRRTQ